MLAGVENDLARLPEELAESGLAEMARAMARKIDDGKGSPSECAKALMQALGELRQMSPPERKRDTLDEINEQRQRRRAAGRSGAAASRRP